jgi:hypothetical protein
MLQLVGLLSPKLIGPVRSSWGGPVSDAAAHPPAPSLAWTRVDPACVGHGAVSAAALHQVHSIIHTHTHILGGSSLADEYSREKRKSPFSSRPHCVCFQFTNQSISCRYSPVAYFGLTEYIQRYGRRHEMGNSISRAAITVERNYELQTRLYCQQGRHAEKTARITISLCHSAAVYDNYSLVKTQGICRLDALALPSKRFQPTGSRVAPEDGSAEIDEYIFMIRDNLPKRLEAKVTVGSSKLCLSRSTIN